MIRALGDLARFLKGRPDPVHLPISDH
jgi:hypothetical protein